MNTQTFTVRPLLGASDVLNNWFPNYNLKMTVREQIEANRKNGWLIYQNARGVYKLRSGLPHIVKRNGSWEGYDNRQAALNDEWPMVRNDDFESVCQTMRYLLKG